MRAFVTRLATVTSCCLALLAVSVPTASASTENAAVEQPVMYFGVVFASGYHDICANGSLREPPSPNPSWNFDVQGSRSSGTLILDGASSSTQTAFLCVRVYKLGAAYGTYTAVFRYQALPSDPPSVIAAQVAWFPGSDGEIVGISQ